MNDSATSRLPMKKSGFDIEQGDQCSQNAYSWSKKTFKNRDKKAGALCTTLDGAFSNMLDFRGVKLGVASDGIGTKIEVAERVGVYDTLGYDLVAMVVDDLVANGFEPTNISNIIDVDALDADILDVMMRGLHDAANCAGIAITGGEIAELGDRICGYGQEMHFNWCATAIGILHERLTSPLDGSAVQAGDSILALKSRGFRSNGFSLLRETLTTQFGNQWHTITYDERTTWGEILLTPSRIYAPVVCRLLDAGRVLKGVAHITGGGIKGNLGRILRINGLGAMLDNLFEPLEVMQRVQEVGKIPAEIAYTYWNMGNGMLLIVDRTDSPAILETIQDAGYDAQIAGEVIADKTIEIAGIA
ncbi:phosphoribosylformylglycinamidine cyclo-ligase [candidate division KSB3 bacterium]|uniref:Phosphoribosylformylglycinamidine cyclo-ligase n=1 Tax=candidate division KSB3 bacterium TaxID=2044937 RepID=A0A9D5JTI7_9BACT|nr:phosphoribosylformylglycinamidine cyclo-ligase [candidate division KSB3 bacterium]MBD3323366.1 phosphoribosylformylglycinamidine cyclo-ligase [candidate division KSB3 bacterium]